MSTYIDNLYYEDVVSPYYNNIVLPLCEKYSELITKICSSKKNCILRLFNIMDKKEKELQQLEKQLRMVTNVYSQLLKDLEN